jgi:hypothetical protein
MKNPLLVQGTNLVQASQLYGGTSGRYALHAGTVDG